MTDAIRQLKEYVTRLERVGEAKTPEEPAALLKWLQDGGLESLKPTLAAYLMETASALAENDEEVPTADQMACAEPLLEGYKPIASLGAGVFGDVYALQKETKAGPLADRVLKISSVYSETLENQPDWPEGKMGEVAGKLGIGPVVYAHTICEETAYIVMQRLSGPTLDKAYPYKPEWIKAALTLYYNLAIQAGISQADLKASNLIFDGERLYLADYGIAEYSEKYTEWGQADVGPHLKLMAVQLIDSLTVRAEHFECADYWAKDNITSRTALWVELNKAAAEWLATFFPDLQLGWPPTRIDRDFLDVTNPAVQDIIKIRQAQGDLTKRDNL
ncbi:Hypothetical protein POVN_LOCUS70 [uncultured virus]|nr:Hypothetical protein POVN_LOCUS70 [uncultured virus]